MNELKPCPFEAKAEAIAAWTRRAPPEPAALPPKERLALNVRHPDCHKAADAFWTYWAENGETHKRGYYESTWGAINRALRTVGVVEHGPSPAATVKDSLTPDAAPSVAPEPVAWRYQDARGHYRYRAYKPGFDVEYAILKPVPLYAAHPPRAPLTDAEIVSIMEACLNDWDWKEFARAVESAVRQEQPHG